MSRAVLQGTAKRGYALVELDFGPSQIYTPIRLTSADTRQVLLGETWESDPRIEIDLAPYTMGVGGGKPNKITISKGNLNFGDDVSNGRAFPATTVRVLSYIHTDNLGGGSSQILYLLKGQLSDAIRNPNKRPDLIRLEVITDKDRMGWQMGMQANAVCINTLGDGLCKLTLIGSPANVTAIDGLNVTIAGLPSKPYTYWARGYVESEGARVMIQTWEEGNTFKLARFPPRIWIDNIAASGSHPVVVFPGCTKGVWPCNNLHGQLDNFNGLGFRAPTYAPQFENPDS